MNNPAPKIGLPTKLLHIVRPSCQQSLRAIGKRLSLHLRQVRLALPCPAKPGKAHWNRKKEITEQKGDDPEPGIAATQAGILRQMDRFMAQKNILLWGRAAVPCRGQPEPPADGEGTGARRPPTKETQPWEVLMQLCYIHADIGGGDRHIATNASTLSCTTFSFSGQEGKVYWLSSVGSLLVACGHTKTSRRSACGPQIDTNIQENDYGVVPVGANCSNVGIGWTIPPICCFHVAKLRRNCSAIAAWLTTLLSSKSRLCSAEISRAPRMACWARCASVKCFANCSAAGAHVAASGSR